jgi:protein tyrosine/serine phosphatase
MDQEQATQLNKIRKVSSDPARLNERRVHVDGLKNVRDIGGLVKADGSYTKTGKALRGETTALLTPKGARALLGMPVKLVVDLRSEEELEKDGVGWMKDPYLTGLVKHQHLNLIGKGNYGNDQLGKDLKLDIATHYMKYLKQSSSDIVETFEQMSRVMDNGQLTYLHCAIGKDRTGILTALLQNLAGATDAAIIADYLATKRALHQVIGKLSDHEAYQRDLEHPIWKIQTPKWQTMNNVLNILAADYTDAEGWLLAHGASVALVDNLKGHLS